MQCLHWSFLQKYWGVQIPHLQAAVRIDFESQSFHGLAGIFFITGKWKQPMGKSMHLSLAWVANLPVFLNIRVNHYPIMVWRLQVSVWMPNLVGRPSQHKSNLAPFRVLRGLGLFHSNPCHSIPCHSIPCHSIPSLHLFEVFQVLELKCSMLLCLSCTVSCKWMSSEFFKWYVG